MRLGTGLLAALSFGTATLSAAPMLVYLGTYTQTTSRGIYAFHFDPETGKMTEPKLAAEGQNLTFLALAPDGRHLYAAGELRQATVVKPSPGGISAFSVDPDTGSLTFLNQVPTGAGATTHVAVDGTGRMVIAANYGAGYTVALPIEADGTLGNPSAHFDHKGPLGPNHDRQTQAHAHSITISPNNRYAYACDLGLDRVFIYRIDPAKASLEPASPSFAIAPPGSGPRHSKFSSDGRFFYVATEMGGLVCTYACDPATGALTLKQTVPTLPADFKGLSTVAEIRIHPNGKFVYVSNRGHDSIAVYSRNGETGLLTPVEIVSCGGKHPRNFALSPDGGWLLCANRDTDNVVAFKVDTETGRLRPTGDEIKVGMPVCVLFYPQS